MTMINHIYPSHYKTQRKLLWKVTTYYDFHLVMNLDYTNSEAFLEMSLSELETFHQISDLERTQILQKLALAV